MPEHTAVADRDASVRPKREAMSDVLDDGNNLLARSHYRLELLESVREMRRIWLSSGD